MAQKDWRRYYAPVFASGAVSPLCFDSKEQLKHFIEKRLRFSNDRVIGILGIRGKDWQTQQQIWRHTL
jgi:hypothetical protein